MVLEFSFTRLVTPRSEKNASNESQRLWESRRRNVIPRFGPIVASGKRRKLIFIFSHDVTPRIRIDRSAFQQLGDFRKTFAGYLWNMRESRVARSTNNCVTLCDRQQPSICDRVIPNFVLSSLIKGIVGRANNRPLQEISHTYPSRNVYDFLFPLINDRKLSIIKIYLLAMYVQFNKWVFFSDKYKRYENIHYNFNETRMHF